MTPRGHRAQRGFTLIELMIALVVSSLLVGMILAIFNRMSISYRGQQQIAGVQQVLAAARATIETDAKQAGLLVPQGFKLGGDATPAYTYGPVMWTDSSTGPDQVAFFYADPSMQALAKSGIDSARNVTIDSNPGFVVGQLVVFVNTTAGVSGLDNDPTIATFSACVARVSVSTATQLTLSTAGPWGKSTGSNCSATPNVTMIYTFVAHAYRIDTTTDPTITSGPMYPSARGVLQWSTTGGLVALKGSGTDTWTDLAYGFTDLQAALRLYEPSSVTDPDGDGDPVRNWYASSAGAPNAGSTATTSWTYNLTPMTMSISLVARTDRDIEGISTSQTPNLIGPTGTIDYNAIGNHASVALPSQAPWSADPLLKGSRVYRYVTFQVDLRNMGIGR